MIQFQNVSFQYNETDGNGIYNINVCIKKGEFVLLSGRSGCGKTTFTRCVNGLIPHFYEGSLNGRVLLKGNNVSGMKLNEIAETVGSVFQNPRSQFFTTDTVSEVAFACENASIPQKELIARVNKSMKELNIEHLKDKSLFELSGGERQRVAIASVHALSPEIYVFDEPSANLDARATEELMQALLLLKKKGATVIISEHRLYYLRDLIDKVIYMENGQIVKEYSRAEFLCLTDTDFVSMGLRCLYQEKLSPLHYFQQRTGTPLLSVEHIDFNYKKNDAVLSDISFEGNKGEIIGIIGNNGEGKSTLAQLLCGLIKEQNGKILISSEKMSPRKRIGQSYFIMQDSEYQLFSESVEDELTLGMEKNPETLSRVEEVLAMLDLEEYRERHPASLSGGQKQRVVIAAAYMRNLKIVVFDEPTSGLDLENMMRVGGLIQKMAERGAVVFVITHDYELLLDTCQRILYLQNGRLVDDFVLTPAVLPQIKKIFGIKEDKYVSEDITIRKSI